MRCVCACTGTAIGIELSVKFNVNTVIGAERLSREMGGLLVHINTIWVMRQMLALTRLQ